MLYSCTQHTQPTFGHTVRAIQLHTAHTAHTACFRTHCTCSTAAHSTHSLLLDTLHALHSYTHTFSDTHYSHNAAVYVPDVQQRLRRHLRSYPQKASRGRIHSLRATASRAYTVPYVLYSLQRGTRGPHTQCKDPRTYGCFEG